MADEMPEPAQLRKVEGKPPQQLLVVVAAIREMVLEALADSLEHALEDRVDRFIS